MVSLMTPPAQDDFLSQYLNVNSINLRVCGYGLLSLSLMYSMLDAVLIRKVPRSLTEQMDRLNPA